MATLMAIVNAVMRGLFDLLLYPFQTFHPMVGLTLVSAGAAVLMLLGYKATSNQEGIERAKRGITAGLFEIRLFNEDIGAILRAQGNILRYNLTYMRLNIVPMLWMLIPFVLVVAQLQFHYGYRGLEVGESTLLEVTIEDGASAEALVVVLPEGLRFTSPRVWSPETSQASWRMVADAPGTYVASIGLGRESHDKIVVVSDAVVRRAPGRLRSSFLDQLLYPAEPALPAGAQVQAIELHYPEREVGLFGFETHWLIVFVLLSIAIAFALKGRFGVTI